MTIKTIFKILAVIILTGVIVGVSVMKSSISAKRQQIELNQLKEDYYTSRDSLFLKQIDDSTRFYIDSILKVEKYFASQIDSLNKYHDIMLKNRLAEQSKKLQTANKETKTKVVKKTPPKDATAEAIRYNYKKMIGNLPGDLTSYERRVSIKEIVVMLSREFDVSPDSVSGLVN